MNYLWVVSQVDLSGDVVYCTYPLQRTFKKKNLGHVNNMMDLNMFFQIKQNQNKLRKRKIAKQFLMAQRFCLVGGS